MKTLTRPNERSYAINKKTRLDTAKEYRLSGFTVPFAEDGNFLMKNTLTGEAVRLTAEEYAAAMSLEKEPAGNEFLEQNSLTELAIHRFIVETGYDEAGQYASTVKLIRLMKPEKPGLSTYTILPTLGCNARCTYCYEEGCAVRTMSRKTADRLVDYICETREDGTVKLSWFGGEPTLCSDTISHICKALEGRGVPFRSRMITNASLITKELAHEMKEVWKLERVQVSLDGDRRDYTERKRYLDPLRHNYDTVMRAVHFLAEEDIKVVLRVNFDSENIGRLRHFLDEMKAEFGENKNVTLYLSPLFQEKIKPGFIGLEREMFELTGYIRELGINSSEREQRNTAFRLNSCMADNLGKCVVIDPEGRFNSCEHLPPENTWGNIFEGVTDKKRFEELTSPMPLEEKCRTCAFLPQCTTFYSRGCPGSFEACREYQYVKTEYELRSLAAKPD